MAITGLAFKLFISIFIIFTICLSLYLSYVALREELLIIGIFSAPINFEQRFYLRKTWLKFASFSQDVKYVFIIGDSMCKIPVELRTSPYSCQSRTLLENSIGSTSSDESSRQQCLKSFTFFADYSIQITHMGIPPNLKLDCPVRVKLKDAYDGTILASVSFNNINDSHLKSIKPSVFFPRYSEGIVETESNCSLKTNTCFNLSINGAARILNGLVMNVAYPIDTPNSTKTGVIPSFDYVINEDELLQNHTDMEIKWKAYVSEVYDDIDEENEIHKDIFLVNITDYYQNLSNKLIRFIKYLDSFSFKYFLKCDDDTVLDLPRILTELRDPEVYSENLWLWGFWKKFWLVPTAGKWRESKYQSYTYPPFPCGAGYVLNKATVHHLASIADKLKYFQGEDVSLGVWLAGVNVNAYQGGAEKDRAVNYKNFMLGQSEGPCEWTCGRTKTSRPLCNIANIPTADISQVWEDFRRKGRLLV